MMASTKPMNICFVTGNEYKKKEVERMLKASAKSDLTLRSCAIDGRIVMHSARRCGSWFSVPELQGETIEVAVEKCKWAYRGLKEENKINGDEWVMTEDTSLGFREMNGLPGVFVKWFVVAMGLDKFGKMLDGFGDKTTTAQTTLVLTNGKSEPVVITGCTDGVLVAPRGPRDFGWDACFEVNGMTYAEMTGEQKDAVSHRGKAMAHLAKWIDEQTAAQ